MRNNANKTAIVDDSEFAAFPWKEEDCRAFGVKRQEAFLAWRVLRGDKEMLALTKAGYSRDTVWDNVCVLPTYMQAMRVMLTQYLNAVCLPQAVKTHMEVASSSVAPESARVKAADALSNYAKEHLESFRDEHRRQAGDMAPEVLARAIKQLEQMRGDIVMTMAHDVQNVVQTPGVDDYLSDFL